MGRLDQKVAVISGAAGGIGGAAARAFHAEGAMVGLLDRDIALLDRTAEELGEMAFTLPADITDEASVESAFMEVKRRAGRLDVLYNCAAVQLHGRDAIGHLLDLSVWSQTLQINLTGMLLCCKHGIRLMLESGGGSIINCGSPTGLTGDGAGYTAYSASKGGVFALTRVLAADYAKHGIRVNTVVPGATRTPLTRQLLDDPEIEAQIASSIPLGRIAVPEDLIGIAVYLASDESRHATGASFIVDGGEML